MFRPVFLTVAQKRLWFVKFVPNGILRLIKGILFCTNIKSPRDLSHVASEVMPFWSCAYSKPTSVTQHMLLAY